MSDGTLSVRRRQVKSSEAQIELLGSGDGLFGEQLAGVGQGRVKDKSKSKPLGDANELMVERRRRKRLRDYDRLLKAFKYSAALDAVLKKVDISSVQQVLN
jgi:U3 small nucleolar RNA-associated protein 15